MTSANKYSRPKDSVSGAQCVPGVDHPPPSPLPSELRVWASSLASDLVFTILSGCTKRLMGGTGRWLSGQSTCHTHIRT